jgi:hypothetical protein
MPILRNVTKSINISLRSSAHNLCILCVGYSFRFFSPNVQDIVSIPAYGLLVSKICTRLLHFVLPMKYMVDAATFAARLVLGRPLPSPPRAGTQIRQNGCFNISPNSVKTPA